MKKLIATILMSWQGAPESGALVLKPDKVTWPFLDWASLARMNK